MDLFRKCLFFFVIMMLANASFSQPQKLSRDSLLIDVDFLEGILKDVHPGLYRYNSENDIDQLFESLRKRIPSQMNEEEWMILLSQTINKIKCGHTYVNPWNMKKLIRERLFGGAIYLPLGFKVINDEMIITHNFTTHAIEIGDKIISINNNLANQIIDSLTTVVKTDGNNTSPINQYLSLDEFDTKHWEAFDLYYKLFFGVEKIFNVQVRSSKNGVNKQFDIPAMTKEDRRNRYQGPAIDQWDFKITDDNVARIKLGTFAIWNWENFSYENWLSNVFNKLDSAQVENLIIDIRGNGGGLGEVGYELLSYLIDKPTIASEEKVLVRAIKIDEKYKPYVDTWVEWIFTGLPKSEYRTFDKSFYELKESFEKRVIEPKKNSFKGKIYMLGDESNVSATFQLLESMKSLKKARFVGKETGGNKQGINGGEYLFFYLPYSGMEIDIPLKFFYGGSNRKDEGVQPDYIVDFTEEDIMNRTDPFVDQVYKLINNSTVPLNPNK